MIKIFFCCSWDPNPKHFLEKKYKSLTPDNKCIWKNIIGITNINDADWVVIIDDIHPQQYKEVIKFNHRKVICIPREPSRVHPIYLNLNFKYKFMYNNFFHCWSSIKAIQKSYDELMAYSVYPVKNRICSSIISKNNNSSGLYKKRIQFIKTLSQQTRFIDKIDLYGYNWTKKELGNMYKGILGGEMGGQAIQSHKEILSGTTKWDGLIDYSYSLAIENCCMDNYFTEKFTDCILAWSIPIYYGCPNINIYFPKDCYYWLDINSPNCFEELNNILNIPITEKQIKSLEIARDLILNKYNVWNTVNTIINNDK